MCVGNHPESLEAIIFQCWFAPICSFFFFTVSSLLLSLHIFLHRAFSQKPCLPLFVFSFYSIFLTNLKRELLLMFVYKWPLVCVKPLCILWSVIQNGGGSLSLLSLLSVLLLLFMINPTINGVFFFIAPVFILVFKNPQLVFFDRGK